MPTCFLKGLDILRRFVRAVCVDSPDDIPALRLQRIHLQHILMYEVERRRIEHGDVKK